MNKNNFKSIYKKELIDFLNINKDVDFITKEIYIHC